MYAENANRRFSKLRLEKPGIFIITVGIYGVYYLQEGTLALAGCLLHDSLPAPSARDIRYCGDAGIS